MNRNPKASARQLEASDPQSSAWVNANAGSGKTHVLVDRVIRLLLSGSEPSKIMCLTFTKAAAAEMSNRLFDRLSAWVSLADAELNRSLANLGVDKAEPHLLQRARQLFTRALETPGGLKIQTIHAFCERMLQLFPVEAGIVPHFTVLDDRSSADLLRRARVAVLASAQTAPDSALGQAVADVVSRVQADGFDEMMKQLLSKRAGLQQIIGDADSISAAVSVLERYLKLTPGDTPASVTASLAIDVKAYKAYAEALLIGTAAEKKRSAEILDLLGQGASSLLALRAILLTKDDTPRLKIATQAVTKVHGWLEDFLANEQTRLIEGLTKLADMDRLRASEALLTFTSAIFQAFEEAKRQRGAYDFDDLIIRAGDLLGERPDAAWVLYKMDGGIEHLLVDEAQDTSPAQWQIVMALTSEFFAGAGRHGGKRRTVFAVGDRKQSIYSFQGADPDIFESVHDEFSERVRAAEQDFRDIDLTVSFRSAPEVLEAVDAVFHADTVARKGLDGRKPIDWAHESNRRGDAGVVELWPLVEPEEGEEREPWTAPIDREPSRSPRRRLAAQLAETIKSWLGRRVIAATGKTVQPEDILVLVRTRNGFFDALIRELRQRGVPVAGADRLKLAENIAVLDLLALARFCVMPEDDYSLACILKSPVLARPLTEDQLMAVAIGRGQASLWTALQASPDPDCITAVAQLARLAYLAPGMRPFEFFSGVLVTARLRFLSRLGSEANDALDALLDQALSFEDSHAATLAGFVNWFAAGDVEIKRNMELGAGEVRIMTVHGAKGLEAPIVILPETLSMPDGKQQPPLLMVEAGNSGVKIPMMPLSRLVASDGVTALRGAVSQAQTEEYRRLLYVAMTRARDELYVCGYQNSTKSKAKDDCWYNLVRDGLTHARLAHRVRIIAPDGIIRLGPDPVFRATAAMTTAAAPGDLPSWLASTSPTHEQGADPIAVSRLLQEAGPRPPMAFAPGGIDRGILIHRLLQQLPDLAAAERLPFAARQVAQANHDPALAAEVVALLDHPDYREIFGPDGLSEIPLVADLPELGGAIAGRIDRLVARGDQVLAVDYKTGRRVPSGPEDADPAHVQQLAAYRAALRRIHPGARVEMALLYTEGPVLIRLPDGLLDQAFDQITVNRP